MFLETYMTLLETYISLNLNESYMKVISPTSMRSKHQDEKQTVEKLQLKPPPFN